MMSMSPSLIYGSMAAGIISAKWQSMQAGALNTVMMLRQPGKDGDTPDDGLPLQVSPTSCTVETMGCPYFSFGQTYFVDFGTNTTADNFYGVMGVEHEITPGSYTTSCKMSGLGGFGRFKTAAQEIAKTHLAITKAEEEADETE